MMDDLGRCTRPEAEVQHEDDWPAISLFEWMMNAVWLSLVDSEALDPVPRPAPLYTVDAAPGTRTRTWWTVPVPAVPPAVRPTVDDPTLKTLVACVALPYPRASAAAGAPLLMFPKRDAFWKIRVTALVTSAFMLVLCFPSPLHFRGSIEANVYAS